MQAAKQGIERALMCGILGISLLAMPSSIAGVPDQTSASGRVEAFGDAILASRAEQALGGSEWVEAAARAQQQGLDTFTVNFVSALNDVTGDGADDVLVGRMASTINITPELGGAEDISIDSTLRISVRQGSTGRELWSTTEKIEDGQMFLFEAKVGPRSSNGFILERYVGVTSDEPRLEITTFRGRDGRELWTNEFTATHVEPVGTKDRPFVTGLFDALPGPQTDLLLSLTTSTELNASAAAYEVSVSVIDGATGEVQAHPVVERAVNWWPGPEPAGDQNGDGLDDYVIGNNLTTSPPETEPGSPEPPVLVSGVLRSFAGRDGEALWELPGLDLGYRIHLVEIGDQFGDSRDDLLLWVDDYDFEGLDIPIPIPAIGIGGLGRKETHVTYVIAGGGELRFKKSGLVRFTPGRIDGDDEGDLLRALDSYQRAKSDSQNGNSLKLDAFNSHGELLWSRVPEVPNSDLCRVPAACGREAWAWDISDVDLDHGRDLAARFRSGGPEQSTHDMLVIDGLTGKMIWSGGSELMPLQGSLDGSGSDLIVARRTTQQKALNRLVLKAQDGRDRSMLFKTTIETTYPADSGKAGLLADAEFRPWLSLGDVTGDGCKDLIVQDLSGQSDYVVIIDASDGSELWSEHLNDPPTEIKVRAGRDHNKAC